MRGLGSIVEGGGRWERDAVGDLEPTRPDLRQPSPAPAGAFDRPRFLAVMVWATLFLLMVSLNAHAATDGETLWGQFKSMWFGAPGLIVGALLLLIAVGGFFRNGFGWSSVVVGVCAVFFLIPGIVVGLQKYAQSIAG